MKKIFLFYLIGFLPLCVLNAQSTGELRSLFDDRSYLYVDSAIFRVVDTNLRDKSSQPTGVWRNRNIADGRRLFSMVSYLHGKMHGNVLGFYANGQVATSNYYVMDVKEGPSVTFWQNGAPQYSRFYVNGELEGLVRTFDTVGRLVRLSEIHAGKKQGVEIEFFPSGNISIMAHYREGERDGARREYADTPALEVLMGYEFQRGIPITEITYENGKVIRLDELDEIGRRRVAKKLESLGPKIDNP